MPSLPAEAFIHFRLSHSNYFRRSARQLGSSRCAASLGVCPVRVAAMSSLAAQDAYLQGLARKVCAQKAPESRKRKFGKAATPVPPGCCVGTWACGVSASAGCSARGRCVGFKHSRLVLSKTCDTGFLPSKLAVSFILTRVMMACK